MKEHNTLHDCKKGEAEGVACLDKNIRSILQ